VTKETAMPRLSKKLRTETTEEQFHAPDPHAGCEDEPCDECKPVLPLCHDPDCFESADGKRGKYCARHEADYANAYAEMVADAMHFERVLS
jgi:hypothetical protein